MFQWSNDASYSPTQSSTLWIDEKLLILPSGPLVPVSVLLFNNCFLGTVTIKHGTSTGFIADGGIANPAPLPPPPTQVLPASVLQRKAEEQMPETIKWFSGQEK